MSSPGFLLTAAATPAGISVKFFYPKTQKLGRLISPIRPTPRTRHLDQPPQCYRLVHLLRINLNDKSWMPAVCVAAFHAQPLLANGGVTLATHDSTTCRI